jgi:transposase InsO family protein
MPQIEPAGQSDYYSQARAGPVNFLTVKTKYEHLFRGPIDDAGALAVELQRFRQIYNTIRPHQALGDRVPRAAYLAGR